MTEAQDMAPEEAGRERRSAAILMVVGVCIWGLWSWAMIELGRCIEGGHFDGFVDGTW